MSDAAALLRSGAAEIVPEGGLDAKLALGRPLRVKLGLDPTAPAVTLGWAVVLRTLRRFQDAGHTAVLIVGDFTARVGDPSGRSDTRPRLSKEQVDGYAERLLEQFGKVVDIDRAEIRRNSEWLEPLGMEDILGLTASTTVARMLERDDFAGRFAAGKPISLMEFLYPLLQGYDSVAVEADVELGGTDQLFNLLVGRDLQRARGMDPQIALTMPLLEGLDGVQKMSQSLGNYVGVDEPPDEMFGKLMSIPDGLIAKYELLCTGFGPDDHARVAAGLADGSIHPNDEKRRMARAVVDLYHGEGSGRAAEERFDVVHRAHAIPDDVPEVDIPADAIRNGAVWLPRLLSATGLASSNADARRLIEQGGVRIDGTPVTDPDAELGRDEVVGAVLQVGRRRFVRIRG
ncbi:MAG TPA: tyrosine--tRNA ligase [Actinomycetota bacterium]|nr:tyrosine--tRNA ligase [Actinomycetota bacterium]